MTNYGRPLLSHCHQAADSVQFENERENLVNGRGEGTRGENSRGGGNCGANSRGEGGREGRKGMEGQGEREGIERNARKSRKLLRNENKKTTLHCP